MSKWMVNRFTGEISTISLLIQSIHGIFFLESVHDTTSSRLTINNLWRQGSSDNLRSGSTSIFRRLIAASDQRRASLVHFFPFHSSKRSSSWASIPRSLFLSSSSIFFRSTAKEAIRFFRILDSPIESRIESTETDEGNSCEWKRKGKLVRGFRGLRTISTINIYIYYISTMIARC